MCIGQYASLLNNIIVKTRPLILIMLSQHPLPLKYEWTSTITAKKSKFPVCHYMEICKILKLNETWRHGIFSDKNVRKYAVSPCFIKFSYPLCFYVLTHRKLTFFLQWIEVEWSIASQLCIHTSLALLLHTFCTKSILHTVPI